MSPAHPSAIRYVAPWLAIAGLASAPALAQDFTIDSPRAEETLRGLHGTLRMPYVGGSWTVPYSYREGDGAPRSGSLACINMTVPNDPRHGIVAACDYVDAAGSFTSNWGCNRIDPDRYSYACTGELVGIEGAYEGRKGAITAHAGEDGTHSVGQWFVD